MIFYEFLILNFIHILNLNSHIKLGFSIWKDFSSNLIEYFSETGHKFSQIYQMKTTNISKKRYMNYEDYIKQPMQMFGMNLNLIISKNQHLINSLDRSIFHTLIREYSIIPFNIQ